MLEGQFQVSFPFPLLVDLAFSMPNRLSASGEISFERREIDPQGRFYGSGLVGKGLQAIRHAPGSFALGASTGLGLLLSLLYGSKSAMLLTYKFRLTGKTLALPNSLDSRRRKCDEAPAFPRY